MRRAMRVSEKACELDNKRVHAGVSETAARCTCERDGNTYTFGTVLSCIVTSVSPKEELVSMMDSSSLRTWAESAPLADLPRDRCDLRRSFNFGVTKEIWTLSLATSDFCALLLDSRDGRYTSKVYKVSIYIKNPNIGTPKISDKIYEKYSQYRYILDVCKTVLRNRKEL